MRKFQDNIIIPVKTKKKTTKGNPKAKSKIKITYTQPLLN